MYISNIKLKNFRTYKDTKWQAVLLEQLPDEYIDEYLEKYQEIADPDVKFDYLASAALVRDVDELKKLVVRHNIDGILFPNVKLAQNEKDRLVPMKNIMNY